MNGNDAPRGRGAEAANADHHTSGRTLPRRQEIVQAEPVTVLSKDEARNLVNQIRAGIEDLKALIVRAYRGRAWTALGYDNWDAFCADELAGGVHVPKDERSNLIFTLREHGLSTRSIASATGVSQATVWREVTPTDSFESVEVIGQDGKRRRARRSAPRQSTELVGKSGEVEAKATDDLKQQATQAEFLLPAVIPASMAAQRRQTEVWDSFVGAINQLPHPDQYPAEQVVAVPGLYDFIKPGLVRLRAYLDDIDRLGSEQYADQRLGVRGH